MQPFLRSLHRDWITWSRLERAAALGLLVGVPLAAGLALALST